MDSAAMIELSATAAVAAMRAGEMSALDYAEALLARLQGLDDTARAALALFDPSFHEGVVGIVAGRLKDRLHRPTFVFARGADGLLGTAAAGG